MAGSVSRSSTWYRPAFCSTGSSTIIVISLCLPPTSHDGDAAARVLPGEPVRAPRSTVPTRAGRAVHVEVLADPVEAMVEADWVVDLVDDDVGGCPSPRSATAMLPAWFSKENQSGTSIQALQPPVTMPLASSLPADPVEPRFCPAALSIMKTISSGRPSPSRSATAMPPCWFSKENQSGIGDPVAPAAGDDAVARRACGRPGRSPGSAPQGCRS